MSSFKDQTTFDDRSNVAQTILNKFPDRLPVIVECSKDLEILKKKFLVPNDLTVARFIMEVRKHVTVGTYDGLFVFVDKNTLLAPGSTMSSVYERYRDSDGFLYVIFSKESSFGCGRNQ